MIYLYEDPVVKEKHDIQKNLLLKAKGDISCYNRIIRSEALKIRSRSLKKAKAVTRSR